MSSREIRKLMESMEAAQVVVTEGKFVKKFVSGLDPEHQEAPIQAWKKSGGDAAKASSMLYDMSVSGGHGDTDHADEFFKYAAADEFLNEYPDAEQVLIKAWRKTGGDMHKMADVMYDLTTKNGYGDTDLADAWNELVAKN
jgi:hypothetical protein